MIALIGVLSKETEDHQSESPLKWTSALLRLSIDVEQRSEPCFCSLTNPLLLTMSGESICVGTKHPATKMPL